MIVNTGVPPACLGIWSTGVPGCTLEAVSGLCRVFEQRVKLWCSRWWSIKVAALIWKFLCSSLTSDADSTNKFKYHYNCVVLEQSSASHSSVVGVRVVVCSQGVGFFSFLDFTLVSFLRFLSCFCPITILKQTPVFMLYLIPFEVFQCQNVHAFFFFYCGVGTPWLLSQPCESADHMN